LGDHVPNCRRGPAEDWAVGRPLLGRGSLALRSTPSTLALSECEMRWRESDEALAAALQAGIDLSGRKRLC
jgi:hypothetical protein